MLRPRASLTLLACATHPATCPPARSNSPRREALEAEAQKVAQLAVNAEGGVAKAKRQLEEAGAELEASQGARSKAADALAQIQAQMAQAAQAAGERIGWRRA